MVPFAVLYLALKFVTCFGIMTETILVEQSPLKVKVWLLDTELPGRLTGLERTKHIAFFLYICYIDWNCKMEEIED